MTSRAIYFPLAVSSILASTAFGASLTAFGTTGTTVSSVNLTTAGTTNWAAWNRGSTPVASAAPNYRMSGGVGTIGNASTTNPSAITGPPAYAATVRGTDNLAAYPDNVFSWNNETNSTAPPTQMAGVFHTTLDQTVHGVQFILTDLPTLASGQVYRINIYGSSFGGTGLLTLSNGIDSATMNTNARLVGDDSKTTDLFQFDYNPDSVDDDLTVSMRLSVDNGNSAHGLIQGIAISIVPEPASGLLTLAGSLLFLSRRRR